MGKTPEKAGVLAMGLRYRRKVPVSEEDNRSSQHYVPKKQQNAFTASNNNNNQSNHNHHYKNRNRRRSSGSSNDNNNENEHHQSNRRGREEEQSLRADACDVNGVCVGDNQQDGASLSVAVQRKTKGNQQDVDPAAAEERMERTTHYIKRKDALKWKKKHETTKWVSKQDHAKTKTMVRGEESEPQSTEPIERKVDGHGAVAPIVSAALDNGDQKDTLVREPERLRSKKKHNRHHADDRELTGALENRNEAKVVEQVQPATAEKKVNVSSQELRVQAPISMRGQGQVDTVEFRRRKQSYNSKKRNPTLLKQLLWKAKPVQNQVTVPTTEVQASQDTSDDDEERTYAEHERHALKQQASVTTKNLSFSVESSSQETQSGSEDEVFTQYDLISTEVMHYPSVHQVNIGSAWLEMYFPTPLPLEVLKHPAFHNEHVTTHEILLEDFEFHPPALKVQKGDVVVWRVSSRTLGMVEHCLDVTLTDSTTGHVICTSSPTLGSGDAIAWRFGCAGMVSIVCNVYKAQGSVTVYDDDALKHNEAEIATETPQAEVSVRERRNKQKKLLKKKQKNAGYHNERLEVPVVESLPRPESPVAVFHPSKDINLAPEIDADVCRAVLSELRQVAIGSTDSFIVIGDVACPVTMDDDSDDHANDGMVVNEDAEIRDSEQDELDGVIDFQQKVIAMLKKSEESQARQRDSFSVESSGFDAGFAYDFFKQRFTAVKHGSEVVLYPTCNVSPTGTSVQMADLVDLLS